MSHHHHHSHADRNLLISILLNGIIVIAEILGGIFSSSLALISDAMHNLSDVTALSIALIARTFSRRLPSIRHTYGYGRFEVLAALANSATLLIVLTLILREAVLRLMHPRMIDSNIMLGVAIVGLAANLASVLLLRHHSHSDLNMRSAFIHLLQDTFSSGAVVLAALIAGYSWGIYVDPVVSVLVALAVLRSGWSILKESLHILMESTPKGLNIAELQKDIQAAFEGIDIHHLHVWETLPGFSILTAHIRIKEDMTICQAEQLLDLIRMHLKNHWNINHSTLELETETCPTPDLLDSSHAASH
jgi:cobalt-zinc-cadmium efflux system protein